MKLAKCLLAAALLVYISGFSIAAVQESMGVEDYDGVTWDKTPDFWKTGFIGGLMSGVHLAILQLPTSASGSDDKQPADKKVRDNLTLADITIDQLQDGIDTFYKDFSNRRVKVIDAAYVVKMQIKGEAQELIEAQVRYLKMQPIPIKVMAEMILKCNEYLTKKGHLPTYEELKKGDYSPEDLLRGGWAVTSDDEVHLLFCYGIYE